MPTRKRGEILLRFWRYLGRNRLLLALAVFLCLGSSTLSLVGPRLAGKPSMQSQPEQAGLISTWC